MDLSQVPREWGSPGGSAVKESACNVGLGSIPRLGRSPWEGNGYPLQYSGLENSMDCIVHGVAESRTWMSDVHFPCDLTVAPNLHVSTVMVTELHAILWNTAVANRSILSTRPHSCHQKPAMGPSRVTWGMWSIPPVGLWGRRGPWRENDRDKAPGTSKSGLRASHLDGIAGPSSFQVLEGSMENFREDLNVKPLETQGLGCNPACLSLKLVLTDTRAKM